MKTKIAIFGLGYVGSAFARFFHLRPDLYDTWGYDPKTENCCKDTHRTCNASWLEPWGTLALCPSKLLDADVVVIAVPTPTGLDGECDTTEIRNVLRIYRFLDPLILLKSTVPPGVSDALAAHYNSNIVFSPEYLGESRYWTPYDFHKEVVESPWFRKSVV